MQVDRQGGLLGLLVYVVGRESERLHLDIGLGTDLVDGACLREGMGVENVSHSRTRVTVVEKKMPGQNLDSKQ